MLSSSLSWWFWFWLEISTFSCGLHRCMCIWRITVTISSVERWRVWCRWRSILFLRGHNFTSIQSKLNVNGLTMRLHSFAFRPIFDLGMLQVLNFWWIPINREQENFNCKVVYQLRHVSHSVDQLHIFCKVRAIDRSLLLFTDSADPLRSSSCTKTVHDAVQNDRLIFISPGLFVQFRLPLLPYFCCPSRALYSHPNNTSLSPSPVHTAASSYLFVLRFHKHPCYIIHSLALLILVPKPLRKLALVPKPVQSRRPRKMNQALLVILPVLWQLNVYSSGLELDGAQARQFSDLKFCEGIKYTYIASKVCMWAPRQVD